MCAPHHCTGNEGVCTYAARAQHILDRVRIHLLMLQDHAIVQNYKRSNGGAQWGQPGNVKEVTLSRTARLVAMLIIRVVLEIPRPPRKGKEATQALLREREKE